MFGDSLDLQELTILIGDQTVLTEIVWKHLDNPVSELLFLLGKVAACEGKQKQSVK